MHILVTGGAGYIGSHTIVTLLEAGHTVTAVDNLQNSSAEAIRRVQEITGKPVEFHKFDLCDTDRLDTIFTSNTFDAVIHFAGLKAVGESVQNPLLYYRNNIDSTLSLLEVMAHHNVHKLVFSSSATVYGSAPFPYREDMPVGNGVTNPYAQTKYIIERIMLDVATTDSSNQFVALRYFNPVGAHASGRIGEDPKGIPNNLMPFISQTAAGVRDKLRIFGDDYDTIDGTCVRDYIHVVDLARGHLVALERLSPGFDAINLGSGEGTSVLQMVTAFERASDKKITYEIAPRRDGDLPEFYADASKAKELLGWHTEKSIEEMCADSWRWQSQNPNGYNG